MANALFDKGCEGFLDGSIDWDTDTIRIVLLDSGYVVNLSTHSFLSDVDAVTRVATSGALAAKTVTAGVADAADVVFTALVGDAVSYVVGYKDSGAEATSRLIFYVDTATGLPFTPSGGDVTVQWDSGSNRIFKL